MHREVMLVIGTPKAVGDAGSVEQGEQTLDLKGNHGFILNDDNGWIPQIAGLKDGGVFADSVLSTGREMIGGSDDNVTETMRLVLSGGREYEHLSKLRNFIRRAREFWTTDHEIEPPYIHWWATGAKRAQYALIYDISVAINPPAGGAVGPMDVTLTIEREPYWRGIPPGANPKTWYFEANGIVYDENNYALLSGTDFLHYEVIQNRSDFTSINLDTFENTNQITIPAVRIPGDAPALVCVSIESELNSFLNRYLVGRSTIDQRKFDYPQGLLLCGPAGAGAVIGDVTTAADTGGVKIPTSSQISRIEIDFTNNPSTLTWTNDPFPANLYRGDFACYVRARQVGGSAGDITMYLSVTNTSGVSETEPVSPVVNGTSGNTTDWPFTYLGRLSAAPEITYEGSSALGLSEDYGNISLIAARSTGAGELYICDVLLLPIDEPAVELIRTDFDTPDTLEAYPILDNTGYLAHGRTGDYAVIRTEVRGQSLTLLPGKDNRLYFFGTDVDQFSRTQFDMTIRLSIVPRWAGIIDV